MAKRVLGGANLPRILILGMKNMTNLYFRPWKGVRYGEGGFRLLLLGEGHDGEPDDNPAQATSTVVEKWRSGEWNIQYLTAAARVLTGKQCWEINRSSDLDCIAFYNFVQVSLPFCGKRPSPEQGCASQAAFKEVLELLTPTHVLATGNFVWEHMPRFDGCESNFQVNGTQHEIGECNTSHGVVLAARIPHLSRYFSPPRWTAIVETFLSMTMLPSSRIDDELDFVQFDNFML